MSPRRLARSLWIASALTVAAASVLFVLSAAAPVEGRDRPPLALLPAIVLAVLAFSTVGALVASRQPRNAIGWILNAVGLTVGVAFLSAGYADYTLLVNPGSLPAGQIVAWLLSWLYVGPVLLAPALLFLLFPDGRPQSPRWRPVVWLALGSAVVGMVGLAFRPGPLDYDPPVENPLAVAGPVGDALALAAAAGQGLTLAALFAAVASMALRLRRAGGEERAQLKWIAYAASLVAVAFAASAFGPVQGLGGDLLWLAAFLAFMGIPMAAGVAILRYRLYDIDLVIRRTLVYAGLTATLAGAYLGLVLLLQLLLSPLTADSGLAIAASTLSVAALVRPARARFQGAVDRRFYRRRYDAARTLEAFAGRLREELDLEALGADLRGVVRETVQPAHVSLWLRDRR